MDALSLVLSLFLTGSPFCSAEPALETVLGRQSYLVLSYGCGAQQWRAWHRWCVIESSGATYLGRPFYLVETHSQVALYLSRFGEVSVGVGAQLSDAYTPSCNSQM
jgi:hypothetical protein